MRSPSVLAYHYPFYRDMLVAIGVGQPVYLGAWLDGHLVGMLPAFYRESAAGVVFSSLPYFGPNAGVLCSAEDLRAGVHAVLLKALLDRANLAGALACSVYTPFLFSEFALYEAAMQDALVVDRATQYLDLSAAPLNKDLSYDLRKASGHGVEVSQEITSEAIDAFYTVYAQNCRDHGIPVKSRRSVEALTGPGCLGRWTDLYLARHEGQLIGGLLVLRSPQTVSYYMPCTRRDARSLQPGTLLADHAMRNARARGVRFWNWESSPSRTSGVYRFKKKWGSLESAYRIYVQPLRPSGTFDQMSAQGIAEHFPDYYVYPFGLLPGRV